jgi:hypothetical protein
MRNLPGFLASASSALPSYDDALGQLPDNILQSQQVFVSTGKSLSNSSSYR